MNQPMNRIFVTAALATAFLLAGCGTSPKEACASSAKTSCKKMWECPDVSVKIGDNQADCEKDYEALCVAGIETSDNKDGCEAGKKYDSAKAQECTDKVEAQTCDQYKAANSTPAACSEICK